MLNCWLAHSENVVHMRSQAVVAVELDPVVPRVELYSMAVEVGRKMANQAQVGNLVEGNRMAAVLVARCQGDDQQKEQL